MNRSHGKHVQHRKRPGTDEARGARRSSRHAPDTDSRSHRRGSSSPRGRHFKSENPTPRPHRRSGPATPTANAIRRESTPRRARHFREEKLSREERRRDARVRPERRRRRESRPQPYERPQRQEQEFELFQPQPQPLPLAQPRRRERPSRADLSGMIPRIEQPIVLYEAEGRPNREREGRESDRQGREHARRRRPPQRIASHPRRRRRSRLRRLRRLARTPLFAYAVAAIVLSIVLFVLTIPTPHYSDLPTNGDKEQAEQPKPRPEHDEYVEPRPIAHEFEGSSADAVRATNAYGVLTRAIGEFEDTGDLVSFAMLDLATGNDLRYDSGRVQYPASSIKAPYTAAVFQELVETGQASPEEVYPIAEETIVESSDDAYSDLHERYGMDVFATWLQNAGIGPGEYGSYGEMLIWHYPHINTDQLLAMWLHMYNYLQSGTEPSQTLASFLERRTVSAMRAALGPDVRTWGKMGWFDYFGDFYSEPATVEGGVVFASEGTYVVAVMTTAPAQISELEPIFTALARAHFEMI